MKPNAKARSHGPGYADGIPHEEADRTDFNRKILNSRSDIDLRTLTLPLSQLDLGKPESRGRR